MLSENSNGAAHIMQALRIGESGSQIFTNELVRAYARTLKDTK